MPNNWVVIEENNMNDAQLIEALGGPAAVARLLGIRVPSVS